MLQKPETSQMVMKKLLSSAFPCQATIAQTIGKSSTMDFTKALEAGAGISMIDLFGMLQKPETSQMVMKKLLFSAFLRQATIAQTIGKSSTMDFTKALEAGAGISMIDLFGDCLVKGQLEFCALSFVPKHASFDMNLEEIMLKHLNFIRGVIDAQYLPKNSLYGRYGQVNEHYLFHGTKQEILKKVYGQGLDFRLASDRTMLGSGVYAAESSTKADQFMYPKHARTSGNQLTMILLRVLLGEPFIHKEPNPKSKFKRPPCMTCGQTECLCPGDRLYDSVIDDVRLFREYSGSFRSPLIDSCCYLRTLSK